MADGTENGMDEGPTAESDERCACGSLTLSTTLSERHDRGLHGAGRCIGSPAFLVDPQTFCGQEQAHGPHRWVDSSGLYAACSGKSCHCAIPPGADHAHRA